MHQFDFLYALPKPWNDCGGTMRELVSWPLGTGLGDFGWHVSVSRLEHHAVLSCYEGVERHWMLLGGFGVHLRSPSGRVNKVLAQRWECAAFNTEERMDCLLLDGPASCLSVMTRQGMRARSIKVLRGTVGDHVLEASAAGLFMVLHGHWRWGGHVLKLGQGRWWSGLPQQPLTLKAESQDAALLCVYLESDV